MNMRHRPSEAELLPLIAAEIGTPFYLYDAEILRERVLALKQALPSVDFLYSMKANPNLSVTRVLYKAGTGCEVSSLLELETALAAGAVPGRIIMVGPGKSRAELDRAVALGIKAIVAESADELEEIDALAAARGRVQDVAIRINPDFQSGGARLTMSGRATQFGIDLALVPAVIEAVGRMGSVRLCGLHAYMGSRILSHHVVAENIRQILNLASSLSPQLRQPLDFVDVGGGFGVPYHEGEEELDLAALGQASAADLGRFEAENPSTRVVIELGRYLVAAAGRFVTGIRRTKLCKGERFAVCDGGSSVHSAASGQGSFLRKNFPITLLAAAGTRPASPEKWTLTGPLCTPQDVIGKDVLIPRPAPGDLLCIHQSGAYGPTASPTGFLGFGAPAEVMVDGGATYVVRRRDNVTESLARQQPQALAETFMAVPAIRRPAKTADAELEGTDFAHPCLGALASLEPLFTKTGDRLDRDPDDWSALWSDPLVRALTTIGVPDEHNGFPLSETGLGIDHCHYGLHVAMVEMLARFDTNSILSMPGPSLSGGAVLAAGSTTQVDRFFAAYRHGPQGTFFAVTEPDAGSDASNGSVRISDGPNGLRLSGRKTLIGGAKRADIGLVFGRLERTGRPVLAMIAPAEAPDCITIERLATTGLRGADLCQLTFTDFPVAPEMILGGSTDGTGSLRDGFTSINGVFERNRPMVAALALGTGRGILDRLEAKPGLAGRFSDLRVRHAALLRQLARVVAAQEAGRPRLHDIGRVKMQAVAFADRVVETAFANAPAEVLADPCLTRRCRDAKAFEYMEGTTHIQLLNAYRSYTAGVAK
jgi:diaminopimelate decarboxylase